MARNPITLKEDIRKLYETVQKLEFNENNNDYIIGMYSTDPF